VDKFGRHRSTSTLHKKISEFAVTLRRVKIDKLSAIDIGYRLIDLRRVTLVDGDSNLPQLFDGQCPSLGQSLDDGVNTDTLLHIRPDLLQDLRSQESNRRGTVSDLSILSTSDIDQGPSGRMNDVEQSKQSSTVVYEARYTVIQLRDQQPVTRANTLLPCRLTRDGSLPPIVHNQFVHSPGSESGSDRLSHSETCRDVAQQLGSPLRRVGALCAKQTVRENWGSSAPTSPWSIHLGTYLARGQP
jgi:hypothetical protein